MANSLYLSPSLDSTLHSLSRVVADHQRSHPFAPITILLPDSATVQAVRKRLGDAMAVRLYQFYGLGQMILDTVGAPVYRLNDLAIRRLVKQILSQMAAENCLTSFSAVWQTPGFQQVLVEWVREMKSQGIPPEAVANHAVEFHQERDRQLAEFYTRYQDFMRKHGCSDADGLLWLAAEAMENTPTEFLFRTLPVGQQLFAALGFDQFNPLQNRILRAFARHCADFRIYLSWDDQRPIDSLAITRLTQTRQLLEEALSPDIQRVEPAGTINPVLDHLRRRIFEIGSRSSSNLPAAESLSSVPGEPPALRLVAAPSREAEVRWALKAIKRLLLDGVATDQIALLAPGPGAYQRLVEVVAAEYGVPVQAEQRLRDHPVVATLLNLITLAPEFPWRATMDALRSPYLRLSGLTLEQIGQLDQLTRERPVLGGRDQWRFALTPITHSGEAQAEDEDLGPARLASLLEPDALASIERELLAFFDLLTPPAVTTYRGYTLWMQQAIMGLFPGQDDGIGPVEDAPESILEEAQTAKSSDGCEVSSEMAPSAPTAPSSLWMVDCCAVGPYAQSDLQALSLVMRALRALVEAAERVNPDGEAAAAWADYRADLLRVLPEQVISTNPLQPGVRFAALEAGRSQAVDHLLVMGLAEGEFPRLPAADVLYAPGEREAHPLPFIRVQSGEQASLWWQVLSNVRCSLALLRPRLDEKGAPWLPSSYWEAAVEAVKSILPDLREIELSIVSQPALSDAASVGEVLLALAESGALRVPPELSAPWQASQAAYRLLRQRQSWQPAPGFEGVLADPQTVDELSRRYGPRHTWSASRLNRYGRCPYSFFAQSILSLEERADPDEGFNAMQRGTLLHAVLEKLFNRLTVTTIPLTLANFPVIQTILEECCTLAFHSAPERYGFQPGALWSYEQAELRRMLVNFIRWECEQNGENPRFQPYRQELRFGIHGSLLPSLTVECQDGSAFLFHGVIDRLDRDSVGRLRLVDYKSGSTIYKEPDIQKGLAFQSPLYALAVEQLLPDAVVAESSYLYLLNRKASGKLEFTSSVMSNETAREAIERAALFVQNIRQGLFPTLPTKMGFGQNSCTAACAFSSLCRADRHAFAKARRGELR